jgi:hypothetical protein
MKMKTYVLIVSPTFPSTHKRKGELTYFEPKILANIITNEMTLYWEPKLHTIRANYLVWVKRIKQIQEGKAILSIRYWHKPGGCYVKNNYQIEICQLDKDSGIGVQRLDFITSFLGDRTSFKLNNKYLRINIDSYREELKKVAKNDGLSIEDFKEWFRKYDLSQPKAIIHFTKFRY